ncbi:MAG TPA: biosynthetic peptidoglycan transglycosylase [Myxococcaceae bacterium]
MPRPPRARRRARRRRWLQRAAVIVLALLSAIAALHSILNSNAVRSRLRDRVEAALAARLGAVEVGSHSDVDWGLRLSFGPVRIAPEPGAPVVLEMERVRVRPRWTALLAGRLEPGLVQMRTVVVRPGTHLEGLSALARRLKAKPPAPGQETPASGSSARLPRLEVEDLRVELVSSQDGHPLDLGAWDAQVEVSGADSARVLEVVVQRDGGGEARSTVRWVREQPFQVEGALEAMPLRPLIELLGQRIGVRATAGSVTARINGVLPADLKRGELEVSGRIDRLYLEGSRLASEPVGPWRLSGAGTVDWDRGSREVRLRDGHIGFGENDSLRVNLEGVYEGTRVPRFRAEARVDQLRYQDAVDALPPQFSLGDEAPRIPGLLDARVRVSGPVRDPEQWLLDVKLDLAGLRAASKSTPFFLRGPFIYRPVDAAGHAREIWVGPQNPNFVPISELPRYVSRAVTTSEDAGFWFHPGFDFDEMKESIIDAAEGSRVRGASTLTQQLAKNLFLSRERTFARKVREALFTVALEASLPKARLMEIYLNIIEWGPGLNGLGEASRHYFGVNPRNLSVQQAAFLATIIPNPVKYHAMYEKGRLWPGWQHRVRNLIRKLESNGIIDSGQAFQAEFTPVKFKRD